jgi:hypothetical protein
MDGGSSEDMLQPRFGRTDVATKAKTTAPEGLSLRALDIRACGLLQTKAIGVLLLPGLLQRFVVFAGL